MNYNFDFWNMVYNTGLSAIIPLLPIILFCVIMIIINNYKIHRILTPRKAKDKTNFIKKFFREKPIKHNLMHVIKTNKAIYNVYNIEYIKRDTRVNVGIYRNNKSILEDEIFEESWGTLGEDSFNTFVRRCLYELRRFIKKHNETIIEDKMV